MSETQKADSVTELLMLLARPEFEATQEHLLAYAKKHSVLVMGMHEYMQDLAWNRAFHAGVVAGIVARSQSAVQPLEVVEMLEKLIRPTLKKIRDKEDRAYHTQEFHELTERLKQWTAKVQAAVTAYFL